MSRTYAHAPYRVQKERIGHIEHDHRNGECVTYEHKDQRLYNHYGKCKKLVVRSYARCTHANGKITRTTWTRDENGVMQEVGTVDVSACDDPPRYLLWGLKTHHVDLNQWDRSVPCICDVLPHAYGDHCDYTMEWHQSRRAVGSCKCYGFPDRRVASRGKVHVDLKNAMRAWNHEDHEDFDWDSPNY